MMISKKKNEKYSRQLDVYFSFIRCVCESYGIRQKTLNHWLVLFKLASILKKKTRNDKYFVRLERMWMCTKTQ